LVAVDGQREREIACAHLEESRRKNKGDKTENQKMKKQKTKKKRDRTQHSVEKG
jgi:hypothetical protein